MKEGDDSTVSGIDDHEHESGYVKNPLRKIDYQGSGSFAVTIEAIFRYIKETLANVFFIAHILQLEGARSRVSQDKGLDRPPSRTVPTKKMVCSFVRSLYGSAHKLTKTTVLQYHNS